MKKLIIGLLLVVILLVPVSCGSPRKENSFLEMLKVVPDTQGTRFGVYISDHAKVRETYDIPLPPLDADNEAIMEYFMALAGHPSTGLRIAGASFVSGLGPSRAYESPIRRQNIGFGPQDVDQDISAGGPPLTIEAIKGDFDLAAIEEAISRCDESVMPDIVSYEGIVIYDWGPDIHRERRLMPPAFDNLGRGGAIAVQEDYVFRVLTLEAVEVMIDASQGRVTSLADNPDFSLMAEALWEMGAHSIFLSDRVVDREEDAPLPQSLLFGPRTYGTGVGWRVTELAGALRAFTFMAIVLVYDSPEEARSEVGGFIGRMQRSASFWTEEPWWRDIAGGYGVWVDGCTIRASFP